MELLRIANAKPACYEPQGMSNNPAETDVCEHTADMLRHCKDLMLKRIYPSYTRLSLNLNAPSQIGICSASELCLLLQALENICARERKAWSRGKIQTFARCRERARWRHTLLSGVFLLKVLETRSSQQFISRGARRNAEYSLQRERASAREFLYEGRARERQQLILWRESCFCAQSN